ncbi:hypothetical protein DY000_02014507 [Brassica cretica]|uniref:DUF4005 domain-containing protein n=1 Tax=Brassica cretica TaxID=69181 RepID=A0ABQ7D7G8_BRACR|nr:hypothetical protein DY000_02014507 [Brassica cretica]
MIFRIRRESARVIPDARNGNLRRSQTMARFCTSSSLGNIRAPGYTVSKASSEAQSFPSSTRISGPSSTRPRSDIAETDHPPGSEYGSDLSGTRDRRTTGAMSCLWEAY